MAWVAPLTWTTAQVVTAANLNQQIRDNMLETAPAKVTAASQILVSTGPNALAMRAMQVAEVTTAQATTSTSYTDLSTAGPAVTVTTGVFSLVSVAARMSNDAAGTSCFAAVAITGASAIAADDAQALQFESSAAFDLSRSSVCYLVSGLTAGSNTFTMKYKVSAANSGTFANRRLSIIPL